MSEIPEREPCQNCDGGKIDGDRYACPVCADKGAVPISDTRRFQMYEAKVREQAAIIERLTQELAIAQAGSIFTQLLDESDPDLSDRLAEENNEMLRNAEKREQPELATAKETVERLRVALMQIIAQAVIAHVDDTPICGIAVAALNHKEPA